MATHKSIPATTRSTRRAEQSVDYKTVCVPSAIGLRRLTIMNAHAAKGWEYVMEVEEPRQGGMATVTVLYFKRVRR